MSIHNFPRQPPISSGGGSEPPMDITERVAKIETLLPTLATKSDLSDLRGDMHKEFNLQTWRIVGSTLGIAALIVAAIKLIH